MSASAILLHAKEQASAGGVCIVKERVTYTVFLANYYNFSNWDIAAATLYQRVNFVTVTTYSTFCWLIEADKGVYVCFMLNSTYSLLEGLVKPTAGKNCIEFELHANNAGTLPVCLIIDALRKYYFKCSLHSSKYSLEESLPTSKCNPLWWCAQNHTEHRDYKNLHQYGSSWCLYTMMQCTKQE